MNYMRQLMNIILNEGVEDDAAKREREQNRVHADALEKTGFWGSAGAGCIIMAQDTKRFLIAHRSKYVEQPNTWGGWGGAIDANEDPAEAVKREVHEETGYSGPVRTVPLYVFKKDKFRYFNFLAIVNSEFEPQLNWENRGYQWCAFKEWPQPLHFGLVALFKDAASINAIKREMKK